MSTEEHYTIQDEEIEMEDTSSEQDEIITHPFNPNDIEIETPPFKLILIPTFKEKVICGQRNNKVD